MKKPIMTFAIVALMASASFAQSKSNSTDPNQSRSDANNKRNAVGERQIDNNADRVNKEKTPRTSSGVTGNSAGKQPNGGAGGGSAKQGTTAGGQTKSAGSLGAASSTKGAAQGGAAQNVDQGNASQGAVNNTPPQTTVKKGSGSSPRNMKNKTGKTGNYENEGSKKNGRQ